MARGMKWLGWGKSSLAASGMSLLATGALWTGCARSLPPEVPEFKAPVHKVAEEKKPPASSAASAPAVVAEAPPPPEAPKRPPKLEKAVAPKPAEPPKAEAKAPSIVGTWQVIDMSHKGQSSPMPAGMTMTFTFGPDGTLSMGMSGGPVEASQSQSRQGSYSVSGESITITMENETKTGTLAFEGNDRAVIDVSEAKMTLSRASG